MKDDEPGINEEKYLLSVKKNYIYQEGLLGKYFK